MIRKILVPVRGDGKGDNVLAHAAAVAHRHMAHIAVVHCRPRPEDLMPYGVHIPEFLRKTATLSFVEEAGRQVDVIKRHGRLADMIAVAKPDRDRNLGQNTLKTALFHSGRPVLMCPPSTTPPQTLGAKVALAWNGSAESARALSQCKSVLRGADKIWILSNGSDSGPGTTTDDLVSYLKLHELEVMVETFSASRKVGAELLRVSGELGADMMIMGAYGDSHERETVFGGNTQTIVDTSKMPVLLNH